MSHLMLKGRIFYAVLDVPKNLRKKLRITRFKQSLKTDSRKEAERLAPVVIAGWKAKIESARTGSNDPLKRYMAEALQIRDSLTDPDIDREPEGDYSIILGLAEDRTFEIKRRDPKAAKIYKAIATGTDYPMDCALEPWLQSLDDTPKTVDMKRAVVGAFVQRFQLVSKVTKVDLKAFVLAEDVSQKTAQRKLSFCRGFWSYLHEQGHAFDRESIFEKVLPRTGSAKGKPKRKAFSDEDCAKLLKGALASQASDHVDIQLTQLIWLGMWTGCRIEEICSLEKQSVRGDASSFIVKDAKTAAGNREVPIHSKLKPLVRHLLETSTDGFLLEGLSRNKYGDRSNAIGKRFGRLRTKLGYGDEFVFHSIRKTVATKLENAGVPENISADILGHETKRITYGLYSGGASLATMSEAIERMSYPEAEAVVGDLPWIGSKVGIS